MHINDRRSPRSCLHRGHHLRRLLPPPPPPHHLSHPHLLPPHPPHPLLLHPPRPQHRATTQNLHHIFHTIFRHIMLHHNYWYSEMYRHAQPLQVSQIPGKR